MLGTASFFLSPQSANPQPNFNFLNQQPQVRNYTFKSLVRNRKSPTTFQDSWIRNRKSATASPQLRNSWNPQPQVHNFVIFEVRNRKSATFYEPIRRVLQSPCLKLICSELISKHKSKVVTCGKYSKRMMDTFRAIKGIIHDRWL